MGWLLRWWRNVLQGRRLDRAARHYGLIRLPAQPREVEYQVQWPQPPAGTGREEG